MWLRQIARAMGVPTEVATNDRGQVGANYPSENLKLLSSENLAKRPASPCGTKTESFSEQSQKRKTMVRPRSSWDQTPRRRREKEERDEIEYLQAALQAATTENESLKS